MKVTYKYLIPALLAGFILGGCSEQEVATPVEDAAEAVEEVAADTAEAVEEAAEAMEEAVSDEPGGYVPTDDERVPGETRP